MLGFPLWLQAQIIIRHKSMHAILLSYPLLSLEPLLATQGGTKDHDLKKPEFFNLF